MYNSIFSGIKIDVNKRYAIKNSTILNTTKDAYGQGSIGDYTLQNQFHQKTRTSFQFCKLENIR